MIGDSGLTLVTGAASAIMPSAAASVPVFIVDADPVQRRALADQIGRSAGHRFTAVACGDPSEAETLAVGRGAIVVADVDGAGAPRRSSGAWPAGA